MDTNEQQMFVRSSKFRHVFGNSAKKENCYEGIRVTKSAHDSNFCAVNCHFLAVVIESAGGGAFIVVPLEKTGRVDVNIPKVCGHRSSITDIKWNPFDEYVIASSSEDCTVKLWRIPEHGLTENLTQWCVELTGHSKKVSYIEWHPSASNLLLSAGADLQTGTAVIDRKMSSEKCVLKLLQKQAGDDRPGAISELCIVWNTITALALSVISVHQDTIYSLSWNRDGSLFATTSKDRMIRVINPRSRTVVAEGEGHLGTKASKITFLGKNRLFTTGFSRHSERQYALWDALNLSKPLKMEDIDSSSGLLIPFYDHDTNMVYLAGKGDGNIRYFEIVDSPPFVHFLSQYQTSAPQRGLGMMPKCGVDVSKCEIVRFYKLHTQKDFCEPICMIVPRKSEMFQADIYPPTAGSQPAMTVDEWISGVSKDPVLVSLKDGTTIEASTSSALNSSMKTQSQRAVISVPTTRVHENSVATQGRTSRLFDSSNVNALESSSSFSVDITAKTDRTSSLRSGSDSTRGLRAVPDSTNNGSGYRTNVDWRPNSSSRVESKTPTDSSGSVVQSSQATVSLGVVDSSKSRLENNFTPSTPTTNQITVKRLSSMISSSGDKTPRHNRLSRNASDVSDLSTTTPLTPLVKSRPRRTRQRHDDDSSSCSSTEAVSQSVDDMWCENPLYATQQGRHRRQSPAKPRRRAMNARFQTCVDTGPLDELLVQTAVERDKFMTRSNAELHLSSPTTVGSVPTQTPFSLLSSTFRSEPDVAMTTMSLADEDTIVDVGRGTMIDCISIEAPDDTVIKPSRLRASMNSRQRRVPVSACSADDLSVTPQTPVGSGVTVRRVGSLRDVPPVNSGFTTGDSPSGLKRGLWKTASLRESRQLPDKSDVVTKECFDRSPDVKNIDPVVSKATSVPYSISSQSSVLPPSLGGSISHQVNATPPGGASSHFTFAVPADVARRRAAASQIHDVLPSYNRNPAYIAAMNSSTFTTISNTAAADKTKKESSSDSSSANNGTVPYEQLLRDFQQLQEKFVRQQDELKILKEQSANKDMKIRRLEDQLRSTRTLENGNKLYHNETVIGVKGHISSGMGVKGVC